MLSEEVIDKVVERLVVRIEDGNEFILRNIGKTIDEMGTLTDTQTHQLVQMIQYGGDYDKITKKISDITKINTKEINELFEEVAKTNYEFSKKFYEYRNKKFIPYEQNEVLRTQVQALAKMTTDKYKNIIDTMAFSRTGKNGRVYYTKIGKMYQEIVDTGVLNISQGKQTFDQEMYRIIKELGESGIRSVDYENGRSMRIDSAVRMHLKDAITNLHNETQKIYGEQFGADGVEISVHLNPAPDHALVQGRQFSKKEFDNFQNDKDAVSYDGIKFPATSEETKHDRRSIGQYNCYHKIFPVILGVNKPDYTNEQLQEIIDNNEKGFEFEGKHYTNYEGTQLQRQIETVIRQEKEKQILAKSSNNEEARSIIDKSQEKITLLTKKYKRLSQASGLPTYMENMRVSGYRRVAKSKLK